MISFFIDTCTNLSIIALLKNDKLIKKLEIKANNDLSSNIFKYITELFESCNIDVSSVNRIYIVNGPGSFTGTRIGVTIAKTFAWSKNIEIVPISELEVIASTNISNNNIALIDARRGYVFAGGYDFDLNELIDDSYIELAEVIKNTNYNFISYDTFDKVDITYPNVDIEKVIQKHKNDKCVNPHFVNPNYLKKTEAEEKND